MVKVNELYARRAICKAFIKTLDQSDDPRRLDAMTEYKRQLAEIDQQITAITGTPPAEVVGLKAASLFGKSSL
jgi:hypothetical protein